MRINFSVSNAYYATIINVNAYQFARLGHRWETELIDLSIRSWPIIECGLHKAARAISMRNSVIARLALVSCFYAEIAISLCNLTEGDGRMTLRWRLSSEYCVTERIFLQPDHSRSTVGFFAYAMKIDEGGKDNVAHFFARSVLSPLIRYACICATTQSTCQFVARSSTQFK